MILSERTSKALDIIVGGFFDLNRTYDRACSVLQIKFVMPQAEKYLHNLAHVWPLMADICSEFKNECNVLTFYPETHSDNRVYDNLSDMMGTLYKETIEVYEMIKMAYKIADEENDLNACAMLMRLTRLMTILIGQVSTLKDKAEQMPTDFDSYDNHIEDWGIDGVDTANPHTGDND